MPVRPSAALTTFVLLGAIATAAAADPPEDPNHTITVQLENDSTRPGSDNYYTGCERVACTSPTGRVPGPFAYLGHSLLGDGQ